MYYSKTTAGFYDPAIHGNNIPADAVEISAERHAEVLAGQSKGQQITADEYGYPMLIMPIIVPYIPQSVTMRQCRLQLLADGHLDDISTAIATMGAAAQIEWEYGTSVERVSPIATALQVLLNWGDARVDAFFVSAGGV